jgi:large subunit ribosomal protein L2
MLLKKIKAITPGSRHQLNLDKSLLYNKPLVKSLISREKNKGGRNNTGSISVRHRGGGSRKLLRHVSWLMEDFQGIVTGIEYDPNRSGLIARVFNLKNKNYIYILATKYLYPGTKINIGKNVTDIRIGNRLPIYNIPAGSILSTVGLKKAVYARAAGTSCQLLQKGDIFSKIRIPSGEIKYIKSNVFATIGVISNENHNLQVIGKAGRNRLKGLRPKVRGVAMNPVDHPHGGAGGKPSVTPWGKPTKGQPTKKSKKY